MRRFGRMNRVQFFNEVNTVLVCRIGRLISSAMVNLVIIHNSQRDFDVATRD